LTDIKGEVHFPRRTGWTAQLADSLVAHGKLSVWVSTRVVVLIRN
jgi:hypothetical protein